MNSSYAYKKLNFHPINSHMIKLGVAFERELL